MQQEHKRKRVEPGILDALHHSAMMTEHKATRLLPSSRRWRPALYGKHNARLLMYTVIPRYSDNRNGVVVLKQEVFFNP